MRLDDLLVIGLGGCGNNQLEELLSINRRYTGLFFNTNIIEMKKLSHYDERLSYYIANADGTGQDRKLCLDYLRSDAPKIMDKLTGFNDRDTIVMLASASGGTGSKAITFLPTVIKKIYPNKSINLVVTMPKRNSTSILLDNATDTWNEIIELKRNNIIDSLMFINNNKLNDENIINKKAMKELNNCLTFKGKSIDTTDSKKVNTSKGYKVFLELNDIDNLEDNISMAIDKSMFYIPSDLESNYVVGCIESNIDSNDLNSLCKGYEFSKVETNSDSSKIVLGGCEIPRKAIKDIREAKEELMLLKRNRITEDIDDLKIRTHKDIEKKEEVKINDKDLEDLFNNDDFWNTFG